MPYDRGAANREKPEDKKTGKLQRNETSPLTRVSINPELRKNLLEGEHTESKLSGMSISHGVKQEDKDKYIHPLVSEGERVKAIFASNKQKGNKRYTVDEYLTAVDSPLFPASGDASKIQKERQQPPREGESRS